eukprot:5745730-Pyramimonas_sp.AAC.1
MPSDGAQQNARDTRVPEELMPGVEDGERNVRARPDGPPVELLRELEAKRANLEQASTEAPSWFRALSEFNVVESKVRQGETVQIRGEIASISNRQGPPTSE